MYESLALEKLSATMLSFPVIFLSCLESLSVLKPENSGLGLTGVFDCKSCLG